MQLLLFTVIYCYLLLFTVIFNLLLFCYLSITMAEVHNSRMLNNSISLILLECNVKKHKSAIAFQLKGQIGQESQLLYMAY